MPIRPIWHAALLLLALTAACAKAPPRPNVLLITMDTTRRDALEVYGAASGITPHLLRLAAESVVYDRARTVAPVTLPAHASIMTGLYPIRHGVRDNGTWSLPQAAQTLAEIATEEGYDTAAFVAAVVLGSEYGLDQGFQLYDQVDASKQKFVLQMGERKAPEILTAVNAWLDGREQGKPFLAWVHFFDPHAPYAPPRKYRRQAGGQAYHGEVAATDAAIGELLAGLKQRGLYDNTCIVLTADHGEDFGQHGESSHTAFCYDTVMRVPLMIRYPAGDERTSQAGQRSAETVSIVDVLPTLCDTLGWKTPAGIDGRCLGREPLPDDRGVYFESYYGYMNYGWSPLAGWADAKGKYLHSSEPEFYLPSTDPDEAQDLYAESGARLASYRSALEKITARSRLQRDAVDESAAARVRELGYAAAGDAEAELPDPLEESDRPAPATRKLELGLVLGATLGGELGHREKAISTLRAVLQENPRNLSALGYLAHHLLADKRWEEAAEAYQELLRRGPERTSFLRNLSKCRMAMDDLEASEKALRRAAEREPQNGDILIELIRLLGYRGKEAEAREVRVKLHNLRE